MTDTERQVRHLRKYLRELIWTVQWYSAAMDKLMAERESHERGKRIARRLNVLDMGADSAARYALGLSFKQIANARAKVKRKFESAQDSSEETP